jgi:hypothetical protein
MELVLNGNLTVGEIFLGDQEFCIKNIKPLVINGNYLI